MKKAFGIAVTLFLMAGLTQSGVSFGMTLAIFIFLKCFLSYIQRCLFESVQK